MRGKILLCGAALCGLTITAAVAQQNMGTQQMSIGQNQSIVAAIVEPVTAAPYQAEEVSRSVQTLGDGTVISHESRGMIARDTQGRVREDLYQIHSGNVNGRQMDVQLQSATVGDPVAHTMLIWTGEKTKIAMQMQLPSLPKLPNGAMSSLLVAPPPPPPPGSMARPVPMLKEDAPPPEGSRRVVAMPDPHSPAAPLQAGSKNQVHTEELGQQSIEGVLVTGKRVTTTIPTGEVGNDRPIVVIHEEWRSPELKILVKSIDSDPRTGEQTMELRGLVRTDPDPGLFQAPAGYQVKDMADMMKSLGNLGNAPSAK